MAQVIRCGIIEDSAKEASLLDGHNGWETKVGGHAGQIIVALVVLVTRSGCGPHWVLPSCVLGCCIPPWALGTVH